MAPRPINESQPRHWLVAKPLGALTDKVQAMRIVCCVPFCQRFTGRFPENTEFLCCDHWAMVDPALKRLRTRIRQRASKLTRGLEFQRGSVHLRITRANRTDGLIWERMKRQAIERAMGISG